MRIIGKYKRAIGTIFEHMGIESSPNEERKWGRKGERKEGREKGGR